MKSTVIPSIGALIVNGTTVTQLKSSNKSHYQMILELYNTFKKFSQHGSYFTGFNNVSFDVEFYRRSLWKNLIPDVYQTNTKGNKHLDILNVIRAAKKINPDVIKTELTEKGHDKFKLDSLSKLNSFNNGKSHNAVTDSLDALSVAKLVRQNTPEIWEASLKTTSRGDTESFIKKNNKLYTSLEYFYGSAKFFLNYEILTHPVYKWSINWDTKQNPKNYIDLDRQGLQKAINATPKVLRTVKTNKSPVLLSKDIALGSEPYSKIGINEIQNRIKILQDHPEFIERIKSILQDLAEERQNINQTSLPFEETLYAGKGHGIPEEKEKNLMLKFHEFEWKDKLTLLDKFSDERNHFFAKCLIFEEAPDILPKSIYTEMHRHFAQRLLSTNKENWETTSSFYAEVDYLREKKYKDDPKMLSIIDEYNEYVIELEKKLENT